MLEQNQAIMNHCRNWEVLVSNDFCMRFTFSTCAQVPWPIVVVPVLHKEKLFCTLLLDLFITVATGGEERAKVPRLDPEIRANPMRSVKT